MKIPLWGISSPAWSDTVPDSLRSEKGRFVNRTWSVEGEFASNLQGGLISFEKNEHPSVGASVPTEVQALRRSFTDFDQIPHSNIPSASILGYN